ncbi:MAG: ribosomal RNA small subunit methyltransferase A [Anaerolineae bacterium]|nr:ribosomal RNA small subunit methyltransferase A [Anaerolineae bacterium]
MNLPPLDIHRLLKKYAQKPKKSLGQNFLMDSTALEKIVRLAEIPPKATVLEIGPGLGSLTRYLCQHAKRVKAVEIDGRFIPILEEVLAEFENVEVIHADILKVDPATLIAEPGYLVVANIPYYITSAVIRHLLESDNKPSRLVLTVQKEVAARICAQPGKMNLLALSVQVYGKPHAMLRIPAGAFYPPPKVDSVVVRVDLHPQPLIPCEHLDTFFKLAKAGFGQKRKTLRNALAAGLQITNQMAAALLEQAGIDPQRRAETLSLSEWDKLVSKL